MFVQTWNPRKHFASKHFTSTFTGVSIQLLAVITPTVNFGETYSEALLFLLTHAIHFIADLVLSLASAQRGLTFTLGANPNLIKWIKASILGTRIIYFLEAVAHLQMIRMDCKFLILQIIGMASGRPIQSCLSRRPIEFKQFKKRFVLGRKRR